ncbi:carbonic anhydrase 6-like isoform X1 [Tenebrio molitor]|uniref:carbonic anhydrase 6-like isoform X1 n=1 Tax=Tenebrio molitor TaxID=7067 RepID=UPI003624A0D4
MFLILIFLCAAIGSGLMIVTPKDNSIEWSYTDQGSWPSSCNGIRQSPIALSTNKAIDTYFGNLYFSPSYYQKHNATITNTGHTIEINFLSGTASPTVSGGGLSTEYVLKAFHFHWGAEHIVNGYRYPLEGHFVHYAKKYQSFENALNFMDGIAVFSSFYDISEKPNVAFNNLLKSIPLVAFNRKQPIKLEKPIAIYDFLPINTQTFYRYRGSLTTPNCNEVVIWTLFSVPSYLSVSQLQQLTHIYNEDNAFLRSNYRKLQNLNGRIVFYKRG